MAHILKSLAAATGVNTLVAAAEIWAGGRSGGLTLLADGIHNLSDELGLACLLLAYVTGARASRQLQRAANLFNGAAILALSLVLLWRAVSRLRAPPPMAGWLAVAVGAGGVLGNWGVAALLRPWHRTSPALRLAYIHNLGDVGVSLAPVLAGLLVSLTHAAIVDCVLALGLGSWLALSTLRELHGAGEGLLWPDDAVCPHPGGAEG